MATKNIQGNGPRSRTETVDKDETIMIHAEKNQDIEVENDETHIARASTDYSNGQPETQAVDVVDYISSSVRTPAGDADGPSTLAVWDDTDIVHVVGASSGEPGALQFHKVTGDWNGDGRDTLGFGDADGDADVDGTDFL